MRQEPEVRGSEISRVEWIQHQCVFLFSVIFLERCEQVRYFNRKSITSSIKQIYFQDFFQPIGFKRYSINLSPLFQKFADNAQKIPLHPTQRTPLFSGPICQCELSLKQKNRVITDSMTVNRSRTKSFMPLLKH